MHIWGQTVVGIRPCFYSNTIRGIFNGAISNKHSFYRVLVRVLSKAPTLMPCPGPHQTFVMLICLLPSPREMQSSPVWMVVSIMLIPIDRPMWIPSVLGLFSGAITLTREKVTFSPPNTFMWNCLLSREIMSWIKEFVTKSNLIFCSQQHSISQTLLILMHIN